MQLHKVKMRLVLAAKQEPKKNIRRISAIVNSAIADLDDIWLANNINVLPDAPIKIAYDSILEWASIMVANIKDEKEATKFASSVRSLINKISKYMESINEMSNSISELETAIMEVLADYGIKQKTATGDIEKKAPVKAK